MKSHFSTESLWEQLATGVLVVDTFDVVRAVNGAAEKLFNKTRRHMLGVNLKNLLPGHPVALDLIARAGTLATPCRVRSSQISPSPDVVVLVSMTAVPMMDEQGHTFGTLLQLEEIGALEQIEQGQRLNDTLDSLGNLAMTVAHEVKNPLAGIRGAAQLLEMEVTGESATTCTLLIQNEVDRVSRLLDSLLGLADDHPLPHTPINIHEVLNHVLLLDTKKGMECLRDFDPSLPRFLGNRDQLIQLFLNLIQNAREAVGEKGEVRINTRISNRVRLEQGRKQRHIVVEVCDNGPGIPDSLRKRIFLPFVTTKPRGEGTGLGLSISQKIVQDHGGLMDVQVSNGQTIFRIYLPVISS